MFISEFSVINSYISEKNCLHTRVSLKSPSDANAICKNLGRIYTSWTVYFMNLSSLTLYCLLFYLFSDISKSPLSVCNQRTLYNIQSPYFLCCLFPFFWNLLNRNLFPLKYIERCVLNSFILLVLCFRTVSGEERLGGLVIKNC